MDKLQFEKNGQTRVLGETESKEVITSFQRYLYDMRVLGFIFQLYSASKEKFISIQMMVLIGYVNAVYKEIYVFL